MSTFTSRFIPKSPWLIKTKVWTIHEMNSKEAMKPPWILIFLKLGPLTIMSWCFKRMIQGQAETKNLYFYVV